MEQAASSSSTAPHHNVEVVELDQEDLELEHQHELERELNHLTKSIISTSELQKQETRKGKAILQSAPEEEDEPTSPIFEPSYQALKLALSLSEGQLENKRRRMSAIDENRASGHNHGHVGHQIFTDSHGNPTMAEGISNTPIYDELKHKEPSMIGTIQPPASAAKIVTSPALDSKPLVPSPLRNEQSPDDPVLTTMPSAEEEMSPTASSPRKFFTRRTLRSGSRTRAAPHTRVRQEAPTLPTGAIRGESPAIVDTSKPTSPLSSFMAEAAKRSGELRRRVSSAGGKKSAKKPKLTRMQRQEVKNLAQKTATQEKDGVQNSPTAVLAAMLAVGATATAVPATLQEEGAENRDSEQTLVGQEDPAAVKETEVPAKAEKEAEKGFFRTRSMRSKAAKNVPAKKDENEGLKEKSATKTIPAPLSFFRRTSQQSVAKSAESGGVGKSNTTRLQAWGATFNTPKAASNTHTPPVVESATQSSEVQAEPAITKAETKPGFFKRLSMRSATSAEEPSSNAPTEITSTAPQIEESVIKPQTDAEIAAKLAVASSAPFVIPTKKNPTRSQPVEAVKPDLASTTTPTLQAFNDPTSKPLEQDAGEASTPKKSSIPRPISIGNPASGPPSPSPAQNPLEPKPRTHVHFARKRGESDCTLCAPEYLQAGTIPAAARVSTELPSVMEAAPTPSVPMVPTSIGTKAMAGAQRTSGESTKARQADADMRTSSFRRSKIPKMIGSGYRGFAANTPTLRKQKSPSPAAANISTGETAEKTPSNRRPRPVNPFRRTARSAANQPELPMLAIALAPSPPIAAAIPEEEPSTPLAELPDTSATHVPKGTTPFSQQRFFRRRSLRTTPSTSTAGKAPPPLPARNLLTETETSAEQQPTAADKTMRRFGSPHKPFFRGRSKRTRRQKSPAPLRKVAQRERFSLEDPEFASSRSKPKTVGARGAAGQWLKRKSVRSSSLFTEPQANEAVVAAPLHEFESLPRRLSVPAVEVPEAEPSAKAKGKRRGERSSSSETPAAGIDTAAVETPVHEFEPLPRRISESTAETETGTKKKATGKSKNLRKRAVARAKRVVKFLQRGSRPRTPPKTKEPARETPVIAVAAPTQEAAAVPVAAPIQEASSTLPTDGGLGASTVTSAASEKGRRSRLPIPLFSKRSMRTKTTPRGPLRAPPALPPRNEPQIPDAQTEGVVPALPPRDDTQVPVAQTEGVIAAPSSCNNSPASAEQMTTEPSATRAVVEDEITPVVETEKVHHDAASDTVESGLQYTREPKKLITYLIPLPMPVLQTGIADEEDIQQRFLIYTPPAPHLLKPAALAGERIRKRTAHKRIQREGKRHWGRRKMQEEVRKANTFSGKTVSFRGIHSKVTKGCVWAVRRIRPTDIVFLNRVNRKEVEEIHLIYPPTTGSTIPQIRTDLLSQLASTQKRAAKHSIYSSILLPITLVIDTVAAIIWPFGGLFEVDAVWWYSSIKGWHTSRSITRRLSTKPSRLGKYAGRKQELRLVFEDNAEARVLERYVADWCHKADPARFPSVGVPPSEGDVERSVGWAPVLGRTLPVPKGAEKGKAREAGTPVSGDEEVQRGLFRDDLKAVVEKGAMSWRKRCVKYEKSAVKAAKKWPSLS